MASVPRTFSSQIIATGVITVGLAVLAAFWALSDPRNELKTLREIVSTQYLTIREHAEYRERVQRDIQRLENENSHQLGIETFNAWKLERDNVVKDMQHNLDELRHQLNEHLRDDRALPMGHMHEAPGRN